MSATLQEYPSETQTTENEPTLHISTSGVTLVSTAEQVFTERLFRRPSWLSPEFLAVAVAGTDFCLILVAAAAAFGTYTEIMAQSLAEPGRHILTSFFAATVFVCLFERIGGYQRKQLPRLRWQLKRSLTTWVVTIAVVLLVAFLSKTSEIYSRGWLLEWVIAVPVLLLIGRSLLQRVMSTGAGATCLGRNIAIVGAGDEGQRLITRLRAGLDDSIIIRGIFDDRKSRVPTSVCGFGVRGTTDDLVQFARRMPIDEVIISLPLNAEGRLRSLCNKLKALPIDVRLSLEPLAETFRARDMSSIGDVPTLDLVDQPLKNWCALAKLIEDTALAALLLIVFAPLLALIALLIKLDSDELPQLINVLRGEMSLVGPRPHAIAMRTDGRPYWEAVEQYLHRHRLSKRK